MIKLTMFKGITLHVFLDTRNLKRFINVYKKIMPSNSCMTCINTQNLILSKLEDREIKRQYQLRESAPNSMNKRMRRSQQEEGSTVTPKNVTRTPLSKARSKGADSSRPPASAAYLHPCRQRLHFNRNWDRLL